jgi:septum formation protein
MTPSLVLASGSPRRRELLRSAGFDPIVAESDIDDALVPRSSLPLEQFVGALAWFKATRVLSRVPLANAVVLAADTTCIDGDAMLGKPIDADDARAMLRRLRGRSHRVATGVALVEPAGARHLFVDVADVALGPISDEAIDAYVESGAWRGKAGGYNYAERVAAGWPVACDGDPTGVMGLPMIRTVPLLESLGVRRTPSAGGRSP